MDKKPFNKTSNFFKKEGFYVILFVCLCIVATVAAVTVNNNRLVKNSALKQADAVQQDSTKEIPKVAEQPSNNYQNALQVKKDSKSNTTTNSSSASTSVSTNVDTSFCKPVEGTIGRAYSENPVFWDSTGSYRANLGIDIKTTLGKPVYAVLGGKVESINSSTADGVEIVINHQNGLKTVYSNLDPKVNVKSGQFVKKGLQIGTVGKTTLRSAYENYGDHLHFAVMKGDSFVNPAKYVKY